MTRHNEIGASARDTGEGVSPSRGVSSRANYPTAEQSVAGASWTAEEEAPLLPYVTRRLPTNVAIALAVQLGRTPFAVTAHIKHMRRRAAPVKPVPARTGPLTTEEVQQAYALFARGASRREVGRALSRSEATMRSLRDRWDNGEDATIPPPVMIRRRCLHCRGEFEQDRNESNFFMCEPHRGGLGDGWMTSHSVGGAVRSVR